MVKLSKIFMIGIFLVNFIFAEDNYLNIDAAHFEADDKKSIMYFKGDVKMTKNKDIFLCQELIVNMEPSKEDPAKKVPKDYKAIGKVSFNIHLEDKILKGKGDIVYYYPKEQKYIIEGNGYLEDTKEDKKLVAQKIFIDEKTGHTKIEGDKDKPVKFRLKLNEGK